MLRLPSIRYAAAALFLLTVGLPVGASAQEDQLRLGMRRTFGYAMGSDIQGSFLLLATGPTNLQQVTFLVDGVALETVTTPPFEARLHTGDYPEGVHRLWAEGLRIDGSTLPSNVIEVQFVSADAGWRAGLRLVTPILLVAVLAVVAMIAVTAFSSRRFQPGVYGGAGGAVCPRCALPMARHVLSPNIGLGTKLERCPHCGKWSLVRRATNEQLAAAEARLWGGAEPQLSPERREEDLRRKVDDSRFLD